MRNEHVRNLEARNTIEAARSVLDTVTNVADVGAIASDAVQEGRTADAVAVIASVSPVTLGRTTYTVVAAGRYGMTLIGPRGGCSHLVQNLKRPELWAHNSGARSTWYRLEADGTYTGI